MLLQLLLDKYKLFEEAAKKRANKEKKEREEEERVRKERKAAKERGAGDNNGGEKIIKICYSYTLKHIIIIEPKIQELNEKEAEELQKEIDERVCIPFFIN